MDTHDLSHGRQSWPEVIARLPEATLVVAISSDGLFTISEQEEIALYAPKSRLEILESPEGHDGFLLEFARLNRILLDHLYERLPKYYSGQNVALEARLSEIDVLNASVFGETNSGADIASW